MEIPAEVLDKGLTPKEFYLLAVLFRNVDRWGEVNLTQEELSEMTGSSRTTLWRDMTVLENKGLVDVSRTKRNYGKLYKNRYKLLCFSHETSTASYSDSIATKETITTKVENTTYSLWGSAPKKEETVAMNKWQDDDEVGGFGLLEGEIPASQRQKPVTKRDPKTRNQRPQDEWTPNDVASEFASQLYTKVRGIPGLINIRKLAPILGKYRKDRGTTALMELEVIEMMMNDDSKLHEVKRDPANAWKLLLRMLATHGKQALENLGMDDDSLDSGQTENYLYASDGRKFDNSMPGRAALERHEQKLQ
jgi:DNA-binding Lrp family transcriptional regulator